VAAAAVPWLGVRGGTGRRGQGGSKPERVPETPLPGDVQG